MGQEGRMDGTGNVDGMNKIARSKYLRYFEVSIEYSKG